MHFWRYGGNFRDGFGFSLFNYLPLLFMIGLIVLVIVLIVKQSKQSHPHHHQPSQEDRTNGHAISIVKERYAKGELSKEEYLELIETLKEAQ